jgi:hypothetical protein
MASGEVVSHGERTFNPLVAGSNPARPTTNIQEAHLLTVVGFLLLFIPFFRHRTFPIFPLIHNRSVTYRP